MTWRAGISKGGRYQLNIKQQGSTELGTDELYMHVHFNSSNYNEIYFIIQIISLWIQFDVA